MGLASLEQFDFSAGMVRAVAPELIPQSGAYRLLNYLVDADGAAFRRGGSFDYSDSAFGTGLNFIWDGYLAAGQRTVFANGSDFGVLGLGATNVVNLGGSGAPAPTRAVSAGGILFIDGGTAYGGALKSDYSTGTVTVTTDSGVVVGAGGAAFTANVDAGMLLTTDDGKLYVVTDVTDNTHLVISPAYEGTGGTFSYTLKRLGSAPRSGIYGIVGKRLLIGVGSKLYFTPWGDVSHSNDDDFHQMPSDARIIGIESIDNTALVLTTDGLWTVSNMDLEPVDDFGNVQHQINRADAGLILWGKEGLGKWESRVIIPATDGIYLFGSGGNERLDLSIAPLYRAYVSADYRPGQAAVHRGHLFLPILDYQNNVIDTLVCRLDRPTRTAIGVIYPWVQFEHGTGYDIRAYVQRIDLAPAGVQSFGPRLWGAAANGSVVQTEYFQPYDSYAQDGHQDFPGEIITRDFTTGRNNKNQVRSLDFFYELFDVHEDVDPTISAEWSTGERRTDIPDWDAFTWGPGEFADPNAVIWTAMDDEAPEYTDGTDPHKFRLSARGRYIRFRFRFPGREISSKHSVKGLRVWVRQSTKGD